MVEAGYLTPDQAQAAHAEPILVHPPPLRVHKAFYFVEYVRQYLEEQYGPTELYRGGFTVETMLDMLLHQLAAQTLKAGLVALDKRYGIDEGPMRHLEVTGPVTTDVNSLADVALGR